MTKFQIWREGWCGHKAQGEYDTAHFLGEVEAETFEDAVRQYYVDHPSSTFNSERLTDWGMAHFDNEEDARRSFG